MTLELAPTPTAVLIEGGVGCGKTAALIARVAALLEDGAAPEDMLVLTATPDAARVLAARLIEAVGERGGAIEVTCTRDVALGLLASEEGRAFSGRAGRLVTPVELGFIMEDMKVSGLKQRRLREMLKFFYRNWTELAGGADDDDRWLIPGEEADTHALLKDVLRFTGGILEPEASAMAVRFLPACPEVLASAQRAHVLVDDYQMHSRASQHLANLLARDSVIVAADPAAVVEVFDSYPYGEGIGEFTQANEGCERIVLNESYACASRKPPARIAGCGRGTLGRCGGGKRRPLALPKCFIRDVGHDGHADRSRPRSNRRLVHGSESHRPCRRNGLRGRRRADRPGGGSRPLLDLRARFPSRLGAPRCPRA